MLLSSVNYEQVNATCVQDGLKTESIPWELHNYGQQYLALLSFWPSFQQELVAGSFFPVDTFVFVCETDNALNALTVLMEKMEL